MRDFHLFRHAAIRYWERRRLLYNFALVPPALFGYALTAGVAYVGDPHPILYRFLLFWFALSALGANICYSFAYALEFLFGSDEPTSGCGSDEPRLLSRESRSGCSWHLSAGGILP